MSTHNPEEILCPVHEPSVTRKLVEDYVMCRCGIIALARDNERARLRRQVEGLPRRNMFPPHSEDCPGRPGYRGICTCGDRSRIDWVPVLDVLALLDEAGAQ